jgi:hypothetical protein
MPVKTADAPEIAARQFTYCSAFYAPQLEFRKFLIMTPDRREAHARAVAYAAERWGEPTSVNVYPRNYVAKARVLYAAGEYA